MAERKTERDKAESGTSQAESGKAERGASAPRQ